MNDTARGIRNNNPLNIRDSKDKFLGERSSDTDSAFKQFISPAYGYRAAFCILGTYLSRGLNTIDKIIRAWAPPQDHNNTEGYIQHVCQFSRVERFKILNANSGKDYIEIVKAMCRVESGVPANEADVLSGFNMQRKLRKL